MHAFSLFQDGTINSSYCHITQALLYNIQAPLQQICSRGQAYSMHASSFTQSVRGGGLKFKSLSSQKLITSFTCPHLSENTPSPKKYDVCSSPAGTISCENEIQVCRPGIRLRQHTHGFIRRCQKTGYFSVAL